MCRTVKYNQSSIHMFVRENFQPTLNAKNSGLGTACSTVVLGNMIDNCRI